MADQYAEIIREAKSLSKQKRKEILSSIAETDLHVDLKSLFERMEPDYLIEITHGPNEFGKDLVIVRKDKFSAEAIGVIVKTGDIRGKTLGEVDELKKTVKEVLTHRSQKALSEILSQVDQATGHPARLKTLFAELPITRLMVILCGEISNNARERIKREIKHPIDIYDIEWLLERFTEYYPQVFFQGRVIDFVQEQIKRLEKTHFFSKSGKTLSECFIDPLVATFDLPVNIEDETFALTLNKRKIQFPRLKQILEHKHRILLVGDPGIGKSGVLAKLTIDMYRAAYKKLTGRDANSPRVPVPILIKAAELLLINNADDLMNSYFTSQDIRDRFTPSVLLIDGLDEVQPSSHSLILERAQSFAQHLDCSLLLTSRKIEAIRNPPKEYERFELLPLEIGQALRLIQKLLENKTQLSALRDGLQKIAYSIPMNPLSLMLLIQLVEEHQEVPASVTELYDRFADMVLGRTDKEKGIEVLFEYLIKKRFLSALAYHEFLEKDRIEIPRSDFDLFLNSYAKEYGWDKNELSKFMTEMDRAGLLDISDASLMFRHRSFLDYFVAFYIFEKRADLPDVNDRIVKLYFDALWDDVAFYYVGLGREINQKVLDGIFSYKPEHNTGSFEKLLAGRLLQAGWHSPQLVKQRGIREALRQLLPVQEHVLKLSSKIAVPIPKLVADFVLMLLSEFSFGSTFLLTESENTITEHLSSEKPSRQDLFEAIALFWSIQRLLPLEKREMYVSQYLDSLKRAELGVEDQGRLLLLLKIIETNDSTLTRTLRRKLDKQFHALLRRARPVVRGLLPDKKKKWRIQIRG